MRLNGLRLISGWPDRQMTLREFAEEVVSYLRALQPLHPLFRGPMHLIGSSPKEFEPLAQDLSNVVTFVQRFGWDDEAPKHWSTGVLPDGTMSFGGTSRAGFRLNVNTTGARATAETCSLRIACGGGTRLHGNLVMEFPSADATEFEDVAFVKRLIQVTIDCWQPESVEVVDTDFRKALEAMTHSRSEVVCWLNYFDRRDAEPLLPNDVHREPFGPQGLLTFLQAEPPRADDGAALDRALRMHRALSPGQYLTYRAHRKSAGVTT